MQNRSPAEAGLLFFARSIERFDEATARPAAPRRNVILDVANLRITDPVAFESELNRIAGVVTVGLFARRGADAVLVGSDAGVRTL